MKNETRAKDDAFVWAFARRFERRLQRRLAHYERVIEAADASVVQTLALAAQVERDRALLKALAEYLQGATT